MRADEAMRQRDLEDILGTAIRRTISREMSAEEALSSAAARYRMLLS